MVPPIDVEKCPPPKVVSKSLIERLAGDNRVPGKAALYHALSITRRQSKASFEDNSSA